MVNKSRAILEYRLKAMTESPEIILIAGPLAVGKSTLAGNLRDALAPCAYIPVDQLRHMVSDQGLTPRHLQEAKLTACRMAECYVAYGYRVVIESVFGEHRYIELMAREIRPLHSRIHLINLEADLATLKTRDGLKDDPNFSRVEEVFAAWNSSENRPGAMIKTGMLSAEEVSRHALELIRSGAALLDREVLGVPTS